MYCRIYQQSALGIERVVRTHVAIRVECTTELPFGQATSSRFCNMAPPRARPTHCPAIGDVIEPMNSVGFEPEVARGGRTMP